ncbi:MAG TPA: hypothetical protein VFM32_08890 [Spongiibacteraceae bacterium]|nr:hypothetical protein [Spongiibacteraceae bacterium]
MFDLADYISLWDHSAAWGVYLAAAAILLLAYTQLTRRWWFELRWFLFVLLAVFLLVPAPVPGGKLLAPAMIMVALSPFTGAPELIAAVITRLLAIGIVAMVVFVGICVVRRARLRNR